MISKIDIKYIIIIYNNNNINNIYVQTYIQNVLGIYTKIFGNLF